MYFNERLMKIDVYRIYPPLLSNYAYLEEYVYRDVFVNRDKRIKYIE